jgi:AcrR family transcriptional regulator
MARDVDRTRPPTSVRDQRRAELRQRLSDTATAMFLQHGFEAVTVADVARACGVTEKTVFNHFPSKESLLIDRWEEVIATVTANLGHASTPVLDAVVATLWAELDFMTKSGKASPEDMAAVRRFGALVASTPALQDHRRRAQQQLSAAIMTALAARRRTGERDAETQIVAEALTGMFIVFYRSLGKHAASQDATRCRRSVRADVRQAARRLAGGIPSQV